VNIFCQGKWIGPLYVQPQFNWRDMWIGLFVKGTRQRPFESITTFYLILIPMFPLKVEWHRRGYAR
jgi:hypothetical protein